MKEVVSFLNLCPTLFNAHDKKQAFFSTYDERHATRFKTYSTLNVLVSLCCDALYCALFYYFSDIQKSIRQLTWLIWAQFVTVAIISGLIMAAWIVRNVFSIKRRHLSSQVSCDKGISSCFADSEKSEKKLINSWY